MQIKTGKAAFQPITITINTPTELANLVGALGAYGKGKTKAKRTLREAGLVEFYSGNVRKAARELVTALAEVGGFSVPDFTGLQVSADAVESHLEDDEVEAVPATPSASGCN